MSSCPWEEIDGFQSPGEFRRFEPWMAEQIEAGNAEDVPVDTEIRGNQRSILEAAMVPA
jgi:hypothetical protein